MIEIKENTYEAVIEKYAELKGRIEAMVVYVDTESYPKGSVIKSMLGIEESKNE